MDLFDLLFLLFIFLAPSLGRLFKRQEQRRPAPQPGPEPPAEADPFGEALRQIREALGEAVPEPEPIPEPRHPEPAPVPTARLEKTRPETEFQSIGAFEHEAHGFGRENPLSEEAFEQRGRVGAPAPIRRRPPKPVDLATPLEVKTPDASRAGPGALARLLRDPQRAREALILHEVLGPPRSRGRQR